MNFLKVCIHKLRDALGQLFPALPPRSKQPIAPTPSTSAPVEISSGRHDCGLRALHLAIPELDKDKVKTAFLFSCENWPHGGVTNKEFNIALRHLDIYHLFEYIANDEMCVEDFLGDKHTYILLIDSHFTCIKKGNLYEQWLSPHSKVYAAWRKLDS